MGVGASLYVGACCKFCEYWVGAGALKVRAYEIALEDVGGREEYGSTMVDEGGENLTSAGL